MKLIACRLMVMVFLTVFGGISANAALELELTQGIDAAMPIAVLPFAGQTDLKAPNNLANVISQDLQNSGRFRLVNDLATSKFIPDSKVDYKTWRKLGADNIILGQLQPQAGGKVQIHLELLATLGNQHLIFSKQFVVARNDLRRLAHHISDLVYQQLTGDRGVFSTRIAYVVVARAQGEPTKYMLEVADADGYNPRSLLTSSQPIMSPNWSPNGDQIAYVSFENKRAEIYVINIYNGQRQLITRYPGINGAPAFSPDGKRLAMVLSKSGQPKIYVYDFASKRLIQLTDGMSIDTEPSWAPDGKSLIFTSNRGGTPQIYQITLAGKQITRVTFDGNYNARASFTPDGKAIVTLHRSGGLFNIAIQDLQSGQMSDLTRSGLDESPSIAPNGKMILYATQYGGNGVLSVVSADGKVKLRLPSREGDVQEPAWSPFVS